MKTVAYPENIIDESSEEIISNPLYEAWHKGYESHKLDTIIFKNKLHEHALVDAKSGKVA